MIGSVLFGSISSIGLIRPIERPRGHACIANAQASRRTMPGGDGRIPAAPGSLRLRQNTFTGTFTTSRYS
ncbi:hypothetical protein C7S16_5416 [Burkholderia thailandensis]|uniref:Uncharacterized protein n=1 Tax=Burkholderia thailandensis TaxID=57975 RepID=A0AAW9CJU2_BURTH|nr:hypothetical protein [Burkholderia thailandensis]